MAAVIGVAGCSGQAPEPGGNGDDRRWPGGGTTHVRLVAFDSCEQALRELKEAAAKHVGPYGLPGAGGGRIAVDMAAGADARAAAPGAASAAEAAPAAPAHSTTNTHEAGVDEPDLVKSDGRRLVVVADDNLRVVDVASRRETGRLRLPGASAGHLLVDGDRALVVLPWLDPRWVPEKWMPGDWSPANPLPRPAEPGGVTAPMPPMPPLQGARLALIDLSGQPEIVGTLDVEGRYVDAREVGGVARVVLGSWPDLTFVYPDGQRTEAEAVRENRRVIERSTVDDWLPHYQLERGGDRRDGLLTDCEQLRHPARYSGSSMLTVLSIPLNEPLEARDAVSVVADGETVYGTADSLYVAHNDWAGGAIPLGDRPVQESAPQAPKLTTEIHQFDISAAGRPAYVASGAVPGQLLNQYSLSEHAGHLRVATTLGQAAGSESAVTVLSRREDRLVEVGQVDGLGKDERIYAVRFLGPVGYVVTFRQTDPLYTLDLAEPKKPKVVGELKITGYSAYLHPAGDGRLIGVGQEATDQGMVQGAQVSLFDVSDPANPRRLAQHLVRGGWSEVEADPHAFLYWPATGLTVLPVSAGAEPGALVLQQRAAEFAELGTVRHRAAGPDGYGRGAVRRALVVGDELWTVSAAGVMVSAAADRLSERAWIPFA